ncbi:sigma factor G inhibitor Gin [Polycladomyces zharkentensis]
MTKTKRWVGRLQERAMPFRCIVCDQRHWDGITVMEEFICGRCEREMVRTPVEHEKYPFFVVQMRKIWLKEQA